MKQSTKLLSMLLALVMAFSCMSVAGSAALAQDEIAYDCINDAALTYVQVSTLALDLVDNDLLAGMDTIDLSIIGELRLDSIDHVLADIHSLRSGLIWAIGKGLLKNIGALNFDPLTVDGAGSTAVQRSNGDYVVVQSLLNFLGDNTNSEILSRIAYGIGSSGTNNSDGDLTNTTQLNLGLVGSFLDLGEVGEMLNDIPSMLVGMVYDMLIHGSYGYDK